VQRDNVRTDMMKSKAREKNWQELSAADFRQLLLRVTPRASDCFRQGFDEIGCHQRLLSHSFARDVARKTMQMNCRNHSFENTHRILRNETRNHAGENVARAAGSHAWISGGVHPDSSVGLSDQSTMTLEYDD